jgi:ribosomal protein L31
MQQAPAKMQFSDFASDFWLTRWGLHPRIQSLLKLCGFCGNEFNGRSISKYCSEKCHHAARIKRVTPVCAHCNKEFQVKPEEANRGRKYCSNKCADSANGIKKRIWKTDSVCPICGETFTVGYKGQRYCSIQCHAKSRKKMAILTCEICGKPFSVIAMRARRGQRYCSYACSGIASGIAQSKKVTLTCMTCGKKFSVPPSHITNVKRTYCSNKCYVDSISGENSPHWKGGNHIRKYPPEWNKELRGKIRDRDGHECVVCGEPEGNRPHAVHHIDEIKSNLSEHNLITLCPKHHARTLYNNSYWQTYLSSLIGTLGY